MSDSYSTVITSSQGVRYWRNQKGSFHRIDGPAVEYPDGTKYWHYRGEFIPVKSQEEFERYLKLKAFW